MNKPLRSRAQRRRHAPGRQLRFEPLEGRRLLAVLFRVNAGGPELAGSPTWQADTNAAPSSFSNVDSGGNSISFKTGATINMSHPSVPAGTPMALFQDERFDKPAGANLLWDFPVSPGEYEVRLYFAEIWSGAFSNGVRVFDVTIEGETVLDDYDVFADVGSNTGVMKSFVVTSDSNLDIDFLRVAQNPAVKAIEILSHDEPSTSTLRPSSSSFNFGTVAIGDTSSRQLTLTNDNPPGGANITINPANASILPSGTPFDFSFSQSSTIVLSPGESTQVTVTYSPNNSATHAAALRIPHSGSDSPLNVGLAGMGAASVPISFSKSQLGNAAALDRPTSLQFGPDGRLYVAQQDGLIRVYTIDRDGANDYDVAAQELITLVQNITNHNDNGDVNNSVNTRLVTGLLVTGTAANPVLYVTSSDPRIGGGSSGTDLNLDTNSSTVSRLTKNGGTWTKVDLVRGLPRSEENHAANGMQLDAATNTLYVAMGGNTNMGATSNNFSFLPEYAFSAAILSIDLDAIGNTTYDLPTLSDETRTDSLTDPFGGNDGRNQAKIVPGSPVQVFAPGFRNPYDLLIHSSGKMYTVDNGPNAGWGDVPVNEGPNGTATNGVNEPGVSHGDSLHFITGEGYYGGHPNPTRANRANTFNNSNPQSPVPVANPIEGDYRVPGPQNGALVVYAESTNGIAEYTTGHFGGAMRGDLIIASFDNTIKRVKLNAAGNDVVSSTSLFTNVGFRPLDVTVPATGEFAGSIWVCDVALGTITVFEPNSSGGGDPDDFDGDGYTNDDEIANGTDPNSPGDVPPDFDADFISNLTDPNDDNDAFSDTVDKFAVDGNNGATTPVGTVYDWENEGANLGGIFGMGFTGLMTNGTSNYAALYNNNVTAGGAAGVFTIDKALAGTALAGTNTQEQAFQFGVNVGSQTTPFVAKTSILGPFAGLTPHAGEEMGFFIGTGDQDNYIKIVLSGDNGGSIQLGKEVGGVFTALASQNLPLPGPGFVELHLTIDPTADTLQASFSVDGAAFVNLGGPTAVPAAWIAGTMAVGLIATDPSPASDLPVTWDFLGVEPAAVLGVAAAKVEVFTMGDISNSSTVKVDSFKIFNNATGDRKIASVVIDLSTAFMPDVVYDPNGTAGDVTGINFTPNTGAAATGLTTHVFSGAHDGGFDSLEIQFNDFNPGELFTFRVDVDPTSVKGSAQPGPAYAASISGLELSGATITVHYVDGANITGQLFALPEGASFFKAHSEVVLNQNPGTAAPVLSLNGASDPVIVPSAAQTIRIAGPVGAAVRLHQTEVALHLAGVPGGGFDVDPYEANKVVFVRDDAAVIGAAGFVDIPVTLRDSRVEGGINYFIAVIDLPGGGTSAMSNVLKVALQNLPPGSAPGGEQSATAQLTASPWGADYDGDGRVDGADFLSWQRGDVDEDALAAWQSEFGAMTADGGEALAAITADAAFTATAGGDFLESLRRANADLTLGAQNTLEWDEAPSVEGSEVAVESLRAPGPNGDAVPSVLEDDSSSLSLESDPASAGATDEGGSDSFAELDLAFEALL